MEVAIPGLIAAAQEISDRRPDHRFWMAVAAAIALGHVLGALGFAGCTAVLVLVRVIRAAITLHGPWGDPLGTAARVLAYLGATFLTFAMILIEATGADAANHPSWQLP